MATVIPFDSLATRRDLGDLEIRIRADLIRLEAAVREAELRRTIKLGTMLAAAVAIVAAL